MAFENFPDIAKLPVGEKLALLEELWDSIRSEDAAMPIPRSHQAELDKRVASLDHARLLTLKELKDRVDRQK
jgi:putative addiction module component (TIGR02574 family)